MEIQLLEPTRNEIRLLTILPLASQAAADILEEIPVQCILETVSLRDYSPAYQLYRESEGLKETPPKRQDLRGWVFSRHSHNVSQIADDKNTPATEVPEENLYRFTWGDYATLSYVWGDPNCTRPIYVNGNLAHVTTNLEACLRIFARNKIFSSGYKLWVDALCINQADREERDREVKHMREIYGHAWNVVIWLGDEAEDSGKAMDLIAVLAEYYGSPQKISRLMDTLGTEPELFGIGAWQGLHQLVNRPFWQRLWILQEIWSGHEYMPIYCGAHRMPWKTFYRGLGVISSDSKSFGIARDLIFRDRKHSNNSSIVITWNFLYRIVRDLQPMVSSGDRDFLPFSLIIDISRLSASSIEVDHIYGMLGMIDPRISSRIMVDYRKSVLEVYKEYAKAHISAYENLEMLLESDFPIRPNFPSWLPNWSFVNPKARGLRPRTAYRAGAHDPVDPEFSNNLGLLTCRGFIIDAVDGLAASQRIGDSKFQPVYSNNVYGTEEATKDAFWRTLIADRNEEGDKASKENRALIKFPERESCVPEELESRGWGDFRDEKNKAVLDSLGSWWDWREANRALSVAGRDLDSFFSRSTTNSCAYSLENFRSAHAQWDKISQWHRFMTTRDGRFGWAPYWVPYPSQPKREVLQGDLICVIMGCSQPLAIRPQQGYYQLVGPCYVHGIMDGEALDLLKTGEVLLQDITLC
jgi:hypothetical protein